MNRQDLLQGFIADHFPQRNFTLEFAVDDADFRRYWRARFENGDTIICMDASPDKMDIAPYLYVQKLFAAVRVPQIYAADSANGFILMEDLGQNTFLQAMQHDTREEVHKALLLEAVEALIALQASSQPGVLPDYDEALLRREINLFPEWFAQHEAGKPFTMKQQKMWREGVNALLPPILAQPKVYVHRDFIVRNLMLRRGAPGVLDFQDAVYGPVSYDILSLTRDAFVEWNEAFVLDIVIRYWEKARAAGVPVPEQFDDFYRAYEFTGVQRHFKVIGIFSRLKHRDHKPHYADEIPRFVRYLRRSLRRYPELGMLLQILREVCGEDDDVQTGYTF